MSSEKRRVKALTKAANLLRDNGEEELAKKLEEDGLKKAKDALAAHQSGPTGFVRRPAHDRIMRD